MIRLSEAVARMHLLEEVKEEHVSEAFRLLSKSIVRVEQPDIQFEDNFDSAWNANNLQTETLGASEMNQGEQADQQAQEQQQQQHEASQQGNKQSIKLSYDEYKRISNMLVYFIRKKEEEIDTESIEFFI
jgi:DNA replication licensing factor MCM6